MFIVYYYYIVYYKLTNLKGFCNYIWYFLQRNALSYFSLLFLYSINFLFDLFAFIFMNYMFFFSIHNSKLQLIILMSTEFVVYKVTKIWKVGIILQNLKKLPKLASSNINVILIFHLSNWCHKKTTATHLK